MTVLAAVAVAVSITLYCFKHKEHFHGFAKSSATAELYQHAAVAADSVRCSEMGGYLICMYSNFVLWLCFFFLCLCVIFCTNMLFWKIFNLIIQIISDFLISLIVLILPAFRVAKNGIKHDVWKKEPFQFWKTCLTFISFNNIFQVSHQFSEYHIQFWGEYLRWSFFCKNR